MMSRQRSFLIHFLDEGSPPPSLFAVLEKKWAAGVGVDEDLNISGCSLCAFSDLSVGALSETGRSLYKLLLGLVGQHTKGVDRLTLLAIDR